MKLKDLQNSCSTPISYKLDLEYVYISFNEGKVFDKKIELKPKKNRVLAIDMNPNYIGWSVVDWLNERDFEVDKETKKRTEKRKKTCFDFKSKIKEYLF